MSYSDRSTSPDPLVRDASPVGVRTRVHARRTSSKPLGTRSHNVPSPSKSFVMDTGNGGDASPWRIKVTVEAEPRQGSSSPIRKMTRTTTVPLKGGSSSPTKKSSPAKRYKNPIADDETDMEIKRPQRKRKGTPMKRTGRSQERGSANVDESNAHLPRAGRIEMSQQLQEELSSPNKRPSPDRITQIRSEKVTRRSSPQAKEAAPEHEQSGRHVVDDNVDLPSSDYGGGGDMTVANEDFTMVSVETLESMKQNTSMLENSEIEKSAASVSYMPSSPPVFGTARSSNNRAPLRYPDIGSQAARARFGSRTSTSVAKEEEGKKSSSFVQTKESTANVAGSRLERDPSEWRRERQLSTQQIETASASQVIIIDEDTQQGAEDDRVDEVVDEEKAAYDDEELDIWADEASRSIEEVEEALPNQAESLAPQLEDLFSDQPLKPPRPKIPRTWRRTSGIDFSYVDSPEHGALTGRKASGTSTEDDDAGGVLTPPESCDDDLVENTDDNGEREVDEDDISLTQPDAAATQLQNDDTKQPGKSRTELRSRPEVISPLSDSSSNTSPDGEDTGVFWQNNLPNVYRRPNRPPMAQRTTAASLGQTLRDDQADSSILSAHSKQIFQRAKEERGRAKGVVTVSRALPSRADNTPLPPRKDAAINSPLKRSLLKSSKVGDTSRSSSISGHATSSSKISHRSSTLSASRSVVEQAVSESGTQSFASLASDQRQLQKEIEQSSLGYRTARDEYEYFAEDDVVDDRPSGEEHEQSSTYEDVQSHQYRERGRSLNRSYEEHLNLDSPQKITVKFNDSDARSSLLAPKKEYPPLFGQQTGINRPSEVASPHSVTLVKKRDEPTASNEPGIFSRLSTTFWAAVVRPSGPTLVEPEPAYPLSLRAQIRNRYGVVSELHPWTMTHMRTLHRLLNSRTSNKADSIVPKSGPLPVALQNLVGRKLRCVTEFYWTFTEQHAHVVNAFMQTTAAAYYVDAIKYGEVEFVGDSFAKECRGMMDDRHGDDPVWAPHPDLKLPTGRIERDFVVKALGNCVYANIVTAEREANAAANAERIVKERAAWEKKNGFVYDGEEEEEE